VFSGIRMEALATTTSIQSGRRILGQAPPRYFRVCESGTSFVERRELCVIRNENGPVPDSAGIFGAD